jgi:hypothetical protein
VSEVNDNFTIPSTGKTVAISELYYNTDDERYYITTHKTPGKQGVTESMMPGQYPLTAKDLNAIKSRAAGGNAALKDALLKINANAGDQGYPTIDYWIQTHSGGGKSVKTNTTANNNKAKTKITKAQFDAAFAKELKQNPNASAAKYKKFLLDTGEYTFAF